MTDIAGVTASTPLALLPIRLETRFVPSTAPGAPTGAHDLLVRIYPDVIHHDTHEPGLAPSELAARERFDAAGGYGTDEARLAAAWAGLADEFGPARAAWIAATGDPGAPDPGERDVLWDRAALARCLPARWIVRGYRGGTLVFSETGRDIPEELPVGPGPRDPRPESATPGAVAVPAGMEWMVRFQAAVDCGMALRIHMPDANGLSRLLVFGVRVEPDAGAAGARRLSELLAAHHYTDGLAMVGHGTPSNNSEAAASGMSTSDPGHVASRRRERRTVMTAGDGSDGARLTAALGLAPDVLAHADGADRHDVRDAQAMNAALWPATWGYFARSLAAAPSAGVIEEFRRHFVYWVTARAPLGTLRVGRQPYGVLPVMALANLQTDPWPVESRLSDWLRRIRPLWIDAAGAHGPGRETIPDMLRRRASSDGYGVRGVFSTEWAGTAYGFMGLDRPRFTERMAAAAGNLAQARTVLGQPGAFAPLGGVLDLPNAWTGALPTVLPSGQLSTARVAWLDQFVQRMTTTLPTDPEIGWANRPADSLLYLLLRRSLQMAAHTPAPAPTPWTLIGQFGAAGEPPPHTEYVELVAAAHHLTALPGRELDGLVRETLDLAVHRLDAWATSLATRRLAVLRGNPAGAGVVVGGYGWLENLEPDETEPVPPTEIPDGEEPGLLRSATNAGFLQAPSIAQAATAAVLRAGHLAHAAHRSADGSTPFAIDLSSARVRTANQVLDGLRQGQTLAALLGYRFERALHDTGLEEYVPAFRRLAPAPIASVAGEEVVDGVRLLELRTSGRIPWGTMDLPAAGVADAALDVIAAVLDAVGDASVAEGVHQALQGNQSRSAAALAVGSVEQIPPPELEFVRTPRTGIGITHRLLLPLTAPALGTGWGQGPRERAEPALANWLASLLPAPERLRADLEVRDPATGAAQVPVQSVRLGDLTPRPLDLLADVTTPADLARRFARHLLDPGRRPAGATVDSVVRLLPDPASPLALGEVYLTEALEILRTAAAVLKAARPADSRDLGEAGNSTVDTEADGVDLDDLGDRAQTAYDELVALCATLAGALAEPAEPPAEARVEALPASLAEAASFGVAGALPPPGDLADPAYARVLRAQGEAVLAEVNARLGRADAAGTSDTASLVARLRALFGQAFTVLPRFSPADRAAMTRAFTATVTTPAPAGQEPLAWFGRLARIRPAVADTETLCTYGQALNLGPGLRLHVGQFPAPPVGKRQRWAGLPPEPDTKLPANATSVVAVGGPLAATDTLAALLVDEWVEVVPATRETTGVAYHYNAPSTQAPQAILLAVSPRLDGGLWTVEQIAQTLHETLDLAHARTVDAADLGLDHLLTSALYVPNWSDTETTRLAHNRLAAAPATFGVPETASPPTLDPLPLNFPEGGGANKTAILQGRTLTIDASGSQLVSPDQVSVWSITDPEATQPHPVPSVTRSTIPDVDPRTRVRLTIASGATVPAGRYAVDVVTTGGSSRQYLHVRPRPTMPWMSANTLRQEATNTLASIFVEGPRLGPTMTVSPCDCHSSYVTGQVISVGGSATRFELRLRVRGNPEPIPHWDPTEPGHPVKRPPPAVAVRSDHAMTLTLGVPREFAVETDEDLKVNLPITINVLNWLLEVEP